MMRDLTVFLPVAGKPDELARAFLDDPAEWLPEEARRAGKATWRLSLRAVGLSRPVECHVGHPLGVGDAAWRAVSWTPVGVEGDMVDLEGALPSFNGEIGLVRDDGHASLALSGSYDVPFGRVGAAADTLVMNRVARGTAERFLRDVAQRLADVSRSRSASN